MTELLQQLTWVDAAGAAVFCLLLGFVVGFTVGELVFRD